MTSRKRGVNAPNPPIGNFHQSLDSWLLAAFHHKNKSYPVAYFPSDAIRDEYLEKLSNADESDVKKLLRRLLVPSVTFNSAESSVQTLNFVKDTDPEKYERMLELEYWRRLGKIDSKDQPQWHGITWVLDLLPHHPAMALEALNAYFIAHAWVLSDTILFGISDAESIIRAYWIGNPKTNEEKRKYLTTLTPRAFEHTIERLYNAMGFKTLITPPSADGGRDVIATKTDPGSTEIVLIEAKLYGKPVGVRFGRALLGTVSDEKANKGVLISNSTHTRGLKELAKRNPALELIDGDQLIPLYNKFLGTDWAIRIDSIIASSIRIGEADG
ncbi:restriction endonuclease [Nocardia sp. NPDC052316]|uniref:restriction endonuclease n=1 Tax=Nocardia sp. NPDC052316 TaxID=3364329 RepID=UPI0037C8D8B6